MLELRGNSFSCCDGVTRRNFLRAGMLGLGGLSLPTLLRLRAEAAGAGQPSRATSVIFVELAGGPSQHETWDPKPQAPAEYRGLYAAIRTSLPGVMFSESFPEQAKVMERLAILRAVHHDSGSHGTSAHLTQTGYYLQDRQNRENEMPCIGSVAASVRGSRARGVPPFISIPREMRFGRAAYLGKGYNAFVAAGDPNSDDFQVPNLELVKGLSMERLADRRALLASFDTTRQVADRQGSADAVDSFRQQAFDLVTSDRTRRAFDLEREDSRIRERYGRNTTGQSLLLARRLIEAGSTMVTVRVGGWDYHWDLKRRLGAIAPSFDQGLAALVTDLYERGMDRDVLVVAMGEFGRTPRMNDGRRQGTPGRDHWGNVMSVLLSGGGLQVGQVVGASNAQGGLPLEAPYRPENVLAMVYRHLGIDPTLTFDDFNGRPRHLLVRTSLIEELC